MADANNRDKQPVVEDLVDDAVILNANAPIWLAFQLAASWRPRVGAESVYLCDDPCPEGILNALEIPLCRRYEVNPIHQALS